MEKLFLGLLLATISTAALAEWIEFADDENVTSYIEVQSIRKKGSTARVWTLTNLKVPKIVGNDEVGSLKSLLEFDCVEERTRTLDAHFFKRKMADGVLPSNEKHIVGEWAYLAPQTAGFLMMEIACGKVK